MLMLNSRGQQTFYIKGHIVNILVFVGCTALLQLFSSAVKVQKQSYTVLKE